MPMASIDQLDSEWGFLLSPHNLSTPAAIQLQPERVELHLRLAGHLGG
jgi:hypothetical protein